jgi:hypothetical protein
MSLQIPILFLIFNRPDETRRVLVEIRRSQCSRLYVAADGPRANVPSDLDQCQYARALVGELQGTVPVRALFRKENLGCKDAVSSAINWFFQHEEEGIILEDDCLPQPGFFDYCAWALRTYRAASDVWHVSGMGVNRGDSASVAFTALPFIWGWATWRDRWAQYSIAIPAAQQTVREMLRTVWKSGALVDYWAEKLRAVAEGTLDTWDYQWLYTIWKNGGLSLTPPDSFVQNIGFGRDATHTTGNPECQYAPLYERSWAPPSVAPKALRDQSLERRIYKDVFSLDLGLSGSFARAVQSTPAGRYIWLGLRRRFAASLSPRRGA